MKNKLSIFLLSLILLLGVVIRVYQVDSVPPGLYIDEASIGYNAYTILTSGKDEHGVVMPLFFKAFGEYKLPVYIYLTVGSFALFGSNDVALRLPSILFGSLTILVMYFFVRELFLQVGKVKKTAFGKPGHVALLAAGLLAITPWHIHFSRGGFEAIVAVFFYLTGCLFALLFLRKKKLFFMFVALVSFAITVYTYSIYKIVAPLTFFVFLGLYFKSIPTQRKMLLPSLVLFLLLNLPMFLFSFTQEGNARFADTSAFVEYPTKSFGEALFIYPQIFFKNYLSFFSLDFLFSHGDYNGRHQMPYMGLFFKWQLPFLFVGLFWLFRQKNTRLKVVLIGLLLLAPLVPSVARPSPNTLRALLMVIPLTVLIACGLLYTIYSIKKFRYLSMTMLILFVGYSFVLYIHKYYAHYPNVNALDWGAAYKETIQKVVTIQDEYQYIIFDKKLAAEAYVHFYAPRMKVLYEPADWNKLRKLKGKVLFVSINYGFHDDTKLIDQIYLPGPNRDVYAQLWEL